MINCRAWKPSSSSSLDSLLAPSSSCGSSSVSSLSSAGRFKPSQHLFQIIVSLAIGGSLLFIILCQQPKGYVVSTTDPKGHINNSNKKAAICAIQKGGLRYLDEWVQYHLLALGFEDIFLYDNSEDFELQAWHQSLANFNPSKLQQRTHIRHFPGPKRQNEAYTSCVKQIQKTRSHAWVAFIDIDEFVVLRDTQRYPYISDFLESLPPEYGGLAMNWVAFFLNHQMHYQDLPVTMRFQNRSEHATSQHIKTIARTHLVRKVKNPHFVDYLLFRWWMHTYDTDGNIVAGPFNPELVVDQIAVYHYQSKSLEEYKERCSRGRADVSKEEWSSQLACKSDERLLKDLGKFPELIKDDVPWQLLKERVPGYASKYTNSTI
ncbi:unnamed protein product [Cylindrotheca closterium]|uniref:Glycosyltransferase family 92 protein n=1 Tax=Cylindrotheca closterium TaxID=2856 RepID=A0AAD2JJA8_9STRA|nr:unnamed protein product [Cylindrotheca closterium]